MLLSGEWFRTVNIQDFSFVEEKISSMENEKRSYIWMSDINEDYIQAGGYADRFAVEIRLYKSEDNFTHYKADKSQTDSTGNAFVSIAGAQVKVRSTQVLTSSTALDLFRAFFIGEKLSNLVYWKDITAMFH